MAQNLLNCLVSSDLKNYLQVTIHPIVKGVRELTTYNYQKSH